MATLLDVCTWPSLCHNLWVSWTPWTTQRCSKSKPCSSLIQTSVYRHGSCAHMLRVVPWTIRILLSNFHCIPMIIHWVVNAYLQFHAWAVTAFSSFKHEWFLPSSLSPFSSACSLNGQRLDRSDINEVEFHLTKYFSLDILHALRKHFIRS